MPRLLVVQINQASQTAVEVNVSAVGAAESCTIAVMDGGVRVASAKATIGTPVSIIIPSPKLWAPDSPHLYDLRITLSAASPNTQEEVVADEVLSYFGLRTFNLNPNPVIPATTVRQDTGLGPPAGCVCVGSDRLKGSFGGPACNTSAPPFCYTEAGSCADGRVSHQYPSFESSNMACLAPDLPPCGQAGCRNLTSIGSCKALCRATEGCAGYTWQPASTASSSSGGVGVCWTKRGPFNVHPPFQIHAGRESQALARIGSSVPLLNGERELSNNGSACRTAVVPGSGLVADADLTAMDMSPCKEMPGTGCPGIPGVNGSVEDCRALCKKTTGCGGFVFKPGNHTCGVENATCWLKQASSIGAHPFRNSTCQSSEVFARPGACKPLLNGNRTFLAGTLDQSWWPDGEYTAPSDEALEYDLIATKKIGFNAIRLHQKVNPSRWYYHADRHVSPMVAIERCFSQSDCRAPTMFLSLSGSGSLPGHA
jgi:hypothetical protein